MYGSSLNMRKELLRSHPVRTFLLIAVCASTCWLLLGIAVQWFFDHALPTYISGNIAARGQFGDMFGAVNALFSALALAGVVTAIWHQRDELLSQIGADRELERQRQSISLLERWHSDEMHECRIQVDRFCKAKEASPTIDWASMYQGTAPEKENCRQLFRIVHFFEVWGRLAEAEVADKVLAQQFLGSHAKEWNLRLISKLRPESGSVRWVSTKMGEGLYYDPAFKS